MFTQVISLSKPQFVPPQVLFGKKALEPVDLQQVKLDVINQLGRADILILGQMPGKTQWQAAQKEPAQPPAVLLKVDEFIPNWLKLYAETPGAVEKVLDTVRSLPGIERDPEARDDWEDSYKKHKYEVPMYLFRYKGVRLSVSQIYYGEGRKL